MSVYRKNPSPADEIALGSDRVRNLQCQQAADRRRSRAPAELHPIWHSYCDGLTAGHGFGDF
jgi:hypothetical protein